MTEHEYSYPLSVIEARQRRGREMAAKIAEQEAIIADLRAALAAILLDYSATPHSEARYQAAVAALKRAGA